MLELLIYTDLLIEEKMLPPEGCPIADLFLGAEELGVSEALHLDDGV